MAAWTIRIRSGEVSPDSVSADSRCWPKKMWISYFGRPRGLGVAVAVGTISTNTPQCTPLDPMIWALFGFVLAFVE